MKVSEQCEIAAAKGNQIIGLIRRNIMYTEKERTIVRPHLEYCKQAWRLYRKKDIDVLEEYKGEQQRLYQNSGILVMNCV